MFTLSLMDKGLMLVVLLVLLAGYGSIMARYLEERERQENRQVTGGSSATLKDSSPGVRPADGKLLSRKEPGEKGKELRQ